MIYLIAQSHWCYDQLRPPATSKCSVVFGSLLKVADDHAMATADLRTGTAHLGPLCDHLVAERYLVNAPNTSLQPVGRREVFSTLLSVGKCRTMVFSSWRKVSLVFSSRQSLIVRDQSASSQRPVSDLGHLPVTDLSHLPVTDQWATIVQIGGSGKELPIYVR